MSGKRNLAFLVVAVMLLSLALAGHASGMHTGNEAGNGLYYSDSAEQLKGSSGIANELYNKILHHYSNMSSYSSLSDAIAYGASNEKLEFTFPEFYAGAFYDTSSEKLVVCYVGAKDTIMKDFTLFLSKEEMDSIVLKSVQYSYSDIMHVYEDILPSYCKQFPDVIINYMIRFTENRISVSVKATDEDELADLYSRVEKAVGANSAEILAIEEADPSIFEETTTVSSGTTVYKRWEIGSWQKCSIGFRAKKTTAAGTYYGFVTAAHAMLDSINDNWKLTDSFLAPVFGTTYSYVYDANTDAVFVQLSDSNTVSTAIADYNGYYNPTSFLVPLENSTVYKSGGTTGCTYGTVISNNFSDPSASDYGISDNILTTVDVDSGDSGGIVFYSANNIQSIVGIVRGHYLSGTYEGYSVFCKGWGIMQALGLQAWSN